MQPLLVRLGTLPPRVRVRPADRSSGTPLPPPEWRGAHSVRRCEWGKGWGSDMALTGGKSRCWASGPARSGVHGTAWPSGHCPMAQSRTSSPRTRDTVPCLETRLRLWLQLVVFSCSVSRHSLLITAHNPDPQLGLGTVPTPSAPVGSASPQ